ncbi:MAG: Stp1/IreP family PP2C-type Ser/Thr phosphatase [Eubacteriales bacterium]|nr:Stp1/IreP family PP2C-type Ser/Thr phosphatase [Eubacteriales bacterium]
MRAYAITDIGKKRTLNQDYAWMTMDRIGHLPNLFVVADGMGGHRGGDHASHMAVETILEEIEKSDLEDPSGILTGAIRRANDCIRREARQDEALAGMGTTVVAATFVNGVLQVANVGDSRLYVVSRTEIRQITEDHSLVQEMVRFGGISREQARNHPDRNIITRAVGVEDDLKVDCFRLPLETGDKVLLCSDGLTGMLEDEEIRRILKRDAALEELAHELIKAANDHGGRDNIAVIIMEPFSDEVSR